MKDESVHSGSRWLQRLFWVYAVAALAIVFYVPTLIPGKFVYSDSYVFGYNNRVAFLLFVPLTAIGALWWRQFSFEQMSPAPEVRVSTASLRIALAVALIVCLFLYWFTRKYSQFGDSPYFVNRIDLASRGLVPYRDFQYNYGVALLYLPLFISRLLHLSTPNGYYIFWMLNVLVGIWMLYDIINRIDFPSRKKDGIFRLLYLSLLPELLVTGVNSAGFRFFVGPLFALMIFQTIRDGSLKAQVKGSLQAVLVAILLMLISPEMATAFCIGVSCFFCLFYLRSANRLWLFPFGCVLLSYALLVKIADSLGVFITFKSFAGGGFSLPIVPAAHILVFFASVFLCACFILGSLYNCAFRSNTLLILLVSLPSLAAAMGRCDPGHVIFNGFGIFLVCFLLVSNNPVAWVRYRLAFIASFIVIHAIGNLLLYTPMILGAWASLRAGNSSLDASTDPALIPAHLHGVAMIPLGYRPSQNPTGLDGGYYQGLANAVSPETVKFKISELAKNPTRELVLEADFDGWCRTDVQLSRVLISVNFFYPLLRKAVHTESVYGPLCAYIHQNYYLRVPPEPDTYGYGIWDRKDTVTPAANQSQAP